MDVPDARRSVAQIVALARHAAMSSSYKPALLKALLRIVCASSATVIPLRDLGAEFLRLYWTQTVVFHMRQAASLSKEPEIVQEIRKAAALHKVRAHADLPRENFDRLADSIASKLRINVLEAFHRSAPAAMAPLYSWQSGDREITLSDGAHAFLLENNSALTCVANLWWARCLERWNLLAPLLIDKVERDGAVRGSLERYLKILKQTDPPACFYCERTLTHTVHVDHVIPWSFLLDDPVWDLVLACAPCNLSKSDSLPDRVFVERLVELHGRRVRARLPKLVSGLILPPHDLDQFYEAALSVEWPSGWLPDRP